MPDDNCFDCLDLEKAVKRANTKGGQAIPLFDELNSIDPNFTESTETKANRIISRRKIIKQNKRREN